MGFPVFLLPVIAEARTGEGANKWAKLASDAVRSKKKNRVLCQEQRSWGLYTGTKYVPRTWPGSEPGSLLQRIYEYYLLYVQRFLRSGYYCQSSTN